jgi:tRNA(fMet)-specific endonuclease VapC
MKYLLDTDHLSILQRRTGDSYSNLSTKMSLYPLSDFVVSTVTFHEQILGCHTYINRSRNMNEIVKGYEMITRLVKDFKVLPMITFDSNAGLIFEQLKIQKIQVATMDLRIACIAIANNLILLTRNTKDFNKIPNLVTENWTL